MNRSVRLVLATCALAVVAACGGGGAELVAPLADDDGGGVVVPGASGAAGSGNSFINTDPDASYSNNTEAAPPCGDACLGPVDAGPVCGNGVVEDGESCDDGNARPGDGCSGICRIEPNYDCPTPGQACVTTIVCGDAQDHRRRSVRRRQQGRQRRLLRAVPGRAGLRVRDAGTSRAFRCITAKCGDGVVNNGEQCDDGDKADGDGCSATCQLEAGMALPHAGPALCQETSTAATACSTASKQCDDGNTDARRRLLRSLPHGAVLRVHDARQALHARPSSAATAR